MTTRLSPFSTLLLMASAGLASAADREPKKPLDPVSALAKDLEPTRTVVYKRVGDRELSLHIFEPLGHKPTDKRSCFIAIHGGGWVGGEPRRFYPFAAHFAKLGMVGISVQYRLVKAGSGVTPFECVKDGRSAVRYVRTHAPQWGIDPQKIVASGGSAGGHVAAGTALFDGIDEAAEDVSVSSIPNALVLYFPVIDTSLEGYGNARCGPRWREISPLHRVKAGLPPTIVFHGTADTTTPFRGAKLFHEAMLKAGNRCELVVHEGGKHGYLMSDRALYDEALGKSGQFLASLGFLDLAPLQPSSAEEPFDYFRNSWNVLGLKDYHRGTRVTPANELLLDDGAKVTLRYGPQSTPLSRRQTKTLMDGWLPIILLSADDGPVRYDFTLWATPLPTVKNWQKAFDWPTEGENFLNWITVKAANTGATPAEARVEVEQRGKTSAETEALAWTLAPGKGAEGVVRIPFSPVADASAFAKEDPKLWLERTAQYWRGVMDKATRIEVPCRKATEALPAAHVCQLIASDHGELHGGERFYDQFYIRDGGYQIMELEEAGLADAASKAIEFYLHRQRPDGRFETQKNQFDANGQALWVLWQYFKITGDRLWLEKAYPQMRRAVDWAMKARHEAPADSPFAGVLPAAPADGEYLWDGKHHIVGYDVWNLRGLLCTAETARSLGKTAEAEELLREAEAYRSAIDAAWTRTGLAHFPPSWEKDGTHWGNTETLWPTELFARDDPRVTALIEHARHQHGGGFVEGTIQWLGKKDAIHPYLSAYTTMASLVRGEHEQVVEDFYWYLLHSAATQAFPEGIFYKRRFAWSDTIPHVTGASNYALMLRHMLVHEAGDELHLLAAVPDWWLEDGKQIRVERAPTHFGPLSLTVRGTAQGVEVRWEPPWRRPPKRTLLHLPKSRPLVGSLPGVEVAVRSDQKKRWDFPTILKLYQQQAPPLLPPPIPVAAGDD